jgi:hypothetical protein
VDVEFVTVELLASTWFSLGSSLAKVVASTRALVAQRTLGTLRFFAVVVVLAVSVKLPGRVPFNNDAVVAVSQNADTTT